MSAATASTLAKRAKPAAKRKARKKKRSQGWLAWWPLLLGVAVTPFAVKVATVMALTGPDGLRVFYPWMLIPKLHLFGLGDSLADTISEGMMYLQFPFYGLLAVLIYRWKGPAAAVLQVSFLHVAAVGLLLLPDVGSLVP